MFAIFAGLAKFERDLIVERTKVGLAAARARGRNGGRPAKMTRAKVLRAKAAMADRETDVSALAGELGVTRQTLYRHVGPGGELRPDGQKLMGKRSMKLRVEVDGDDATSVVRILWIAALT